MDVREKLIDLLTGYSIDTQPDVEYVADHLISNGVTVQECGYWVSLTDCANAGVYCSICNKKIYKDDYARCNTKNKLPSDYCQHCGAKMMPHPTKGE